MAITAGQEIQAADFVASGGSANASKGVKMDAAGRLNGFFTRFGGTGADGALAITSGATNIDLGGARVVIKNYSSISITGTGSLTFSNPHANGTIIILRSQGDVTLTSSAAPMIDASAMGAAGGASVNTTTDGLAGTDAQSVYKKASAGAGSTPAGGGAGGAAPSSYISTVMDHIYYTLFYHWVLCGAGGGSGFANVVGGDDSSGAGGRGGGALIIECAGAWNFTTASGISVKGGNGNNGSVTGSGYTMGGGGGGGGHFLALYNTLTANSGTVTTTGGTGGNMACSGFGGGTYTGGGGGASVTTAGSGGSNPGTCGSSKNGGDGATGLSLITSVLDYFA